MTGREVRHLPFLSWKDPDAWMETMKGPRWNALLRKEGGLFRDLVQNKTIRALEKEFCKDFDTLLPFTSQEIYSLGCGSVLVTIQKSDTLLWRWKWKKERREAYDIDVVGNHIWFIVKSPKSEYENILICENADGTELWRRTRVSPQVAINNGLCYFVKTERVFDDVAFCACDAFTGENVQTLYKEPDRSRHLTMINESNRTLYLKSVEASESRCWRVHGTELFELDPGTSVQFPLGICSNGDDCRIVKKPTSKKFELRGREIEKWILPTESEIPEWVSLQTGHLMTLFEGAHTIWRCREKEAPRKIFHILAGDIFPNPWSKWENQLVQTFHVQSPAEPPYTIHVLGDQYTVEKIQARPIRDLFAPLVVRKWYGTSLDGSRVPYVIVNQSEFSGNIRGLLVSGYGAYGLSTVVGWPNYGWYPLLKRGWAIAYAFVRGGGDVDEEWAEVARIENRHKSIEDFEAVIRDSQKRASVGPDQTVIYGRSAGGFLVGSVALRQPHGELVGAVYTEVPFVDILRTLTNPDLPLTQGEYDDFGNPQKNVVLFREMMKISPVNATPACGVPGVFVLARTGLKDRQVLAYEPFKWIQKLRGNECVGPCGKYISFEKDQAHVYSTNKGFRARATDLAILEAWLVKKIASNSIMSDSVARKSARNGGKRKNARRTARKTEGGKRKNARRSTARKMEAGKRKNARRNTARNGGKRKNARREH